MMLWNSACVLCGMYAICLGAIASTCQDYQTGILSVAALLAAFSATIEAK